MFMTRSIIVLLNEYEWWMMDAAAAAITISTNTTFGFSALMEWSQLH